MSILMGLDQHRAQTTAEWIDTETGEITRSRIAPAHRDAVRRVCEKFCGLARDRLGGGYRLAVRGR